MRGRIGQERRGGPDGAIVSSLARRPMGEDCSFAAETSQVPARWPAASEGSQSSRRDSLDSAQRRSLAGFAGRISLAGNVLAETSRLGRARSLAHHLARIFGRTEPTRATQLERVVFGRQFRSSKKGGSKVG